MQVFLGITAPRTSAPCAAPGGPVASPAARPGPAAQPASTPPRGPASPPPAQRGASRRSPAAGHLQQASARPRPAPPSLTPRLAPLKKARRTNS
ncbi:DNA translocase FtsK, partial [Frankliniella fusca]